MSAPRLPQEPARRKVLLVLDRKDRTRLEHSPDGSNLLHHNDVAVVTPTATERHPLLTDLDARGLLTPGRVLLQNPYERDRYADAGDALDQFALEKYLLFSEFCMLLGARAVRVLELREERAGAERTYSVGAGRGPIDVKTKADSVESSHLARQLSVEDRWIGAPCDSAAAAALLQRHNVDDVGMRSLLRARSQAPQVGLNRTLELKLTSDASTSRQIAVGLRIPGYLKLNAAYEQLVSLHCEYRVSVAVDFPGV